MRFLTPSLAVLLLGFIVAPARADHPLACQGDQCAERRSHPLSFLRLHRGSHEGCEQPKSHSLFGWLKPCHPSLLKCGGPGHCKFGECGYHPWFNTFRPCPDNAFPTHPFARSPRDFFMYEW